MAGIEVVVADITTLEVDAIVNAANRTLLGGGGVDGAIHRAAGPGLLAECRGLGGCETGAAKVTGGHDLPAKHVIHTVGPVWGGRPDETDPKLAACYANALDEAVRLGCRSVAFPAISTGVYGYPADCAARIAVTTLRAGLGRLDDPPRVLLVAFDDRAGQTLRAALEAAP